MRQQSASSPRADPRRAPVFTSRLPERRNPPDPAADPMARGRKRWARAAAFFRVPFFRPWAPNEERQMGGRALQVQNGKNTWLFLCDSGGFKVFKDN